MPAKMMSEMPLPMPRSVICSPSHMRNIVPVVSVIIAVIRNMQPRIDHETALGFERDRDAHRLEQREPERAVARCTA